MVLRSLCCDPQSSDPSQVAVRVKHMYLAFEDIAPHNGGIVRTVLDNVVVEELCEEDLPNWVSDNE